MLERTTGPDKIIMAEHSWEALLVLAFIMIDSDNTDKALSILKGMETISRQDVQVHKLMAYAYSKLNMPHESLRYIDASMHSVLSAEDIKGMTLLKARALSANGEDQAAQDLLEAISQA